MGVIQVEVKWQKQVFKDIDLDLEQPVAVFKMQLFSLTGVQPERQKIMGVKGGLLKDDVDLSALGIKPGQKLTMMGTADKVPEAPTEQQTFVEDLPEDEQDTTGLGQYGAGLQNLGNTCYMNSCLQCMYAVPELRSSLNLYGTGSSQPQAGADPHHGMAIAAKNLFNSLQRSAQPMPPMEFVLSLRRAFPQFDARSREGYHMQQDAEECWSAVLVGLRDRVTDTSGTSAINSLFGCKLHTELKSEESEETIASDEVNLMLKCNITSEVNHLLEGIKVAMGSDREQMSAELGRNVNFRGEARIAQLPPYLTVQMVRFYYKQDVQQKAKILRKVSFPLMLDVYEFCTPELQKQLEGPRAAAKEAEDAKVGLVAKKAKIEAAAAAPAGDVDMADAAGTASADDNTKGALTGRYELLGVLTHKGRSADSGHYVSWVKQTDGQWIQFDDDQMILRKEEEVLTLCGGGDWHMAYLLLYKAIRAPVA